MDMKGAFRATVELASKLWHLRRDSFLDSSLSLAHLEDMLATVEREEFSEGKLGRWLGWAQAAVVAAGVASLEDMKAINVAYSGKEALPLDPYPWVDYWARSAHREAPGDVFSPREGYEQNRANYPEGVR